MQACRNHTLGEQVKEEFYKDKATESSQILVLSLDLASMDSIRSFVKQFQRLQLPLHYLILNAGVLGVDLSYTRDNVEMHFGVNHLGHFMLSLLLMETMINTKDSRMVIVSSTMYVLGSLHFLDDMHYKKRRYSSFEAYSCSKLCNLLFMHELCKRCTSANLNYPSIVAVHPGYVHTRVARHLNEWVYYLYDRVASLFLSSPEQGAATVYAAAVDWKSFSGIFTTNVDQLLTLAPNAVDDSASKCLWRKSLSLLYLPPQVIDKLRYLGMVDEDEYLQCRMKR
jgi:retinol dehydrogenase-14